MDGIDFHLAWAGSISGQVTEKDGTVPVEGASVYASPISGDYPGAGANTQPDGSYILQGLPRGSYRVRVTASGYASGQAKQATVKALGDTPGVNFALDPEIRNSPLPAPAPR